MHTNWTQTKAASFTTEGIQKMDEIAKTVFAPIYPVIADNALSATGIRQGLCIDLGSGPAMLAMAVARQAPEMRVIAFDFSEDARSIAEQNVAEANLGDRIHTATGDVHAMPFETGYADLMVSRGSMFFWKDLEAAFREIYRVLAPGGATYIGGGFGSQELKDQVVAEMLKIDPNWDCYAKKKTDTESQQRFREMLHALGCHDFSLIDDGSGFWILLRKHG